MGWEASFHRRWCIAHPRELEILHLRILIVSSQTGAFFGKRALHGPIQRQDYGEEAGEAWRGHSSAVPTREKLQGCADFARALQEPVGGGYIVKIEARCGLRPGRA